MSSILKKTDLGAWAAALEAEVFAPALADGVWAYQPVAPGANDGGVALTHPNTARPPKNFAFPQREVLYTFEQLKGQAPKLTETLPNPAPVVVMGVRPCDGRGAPRNDMVFTGAFDDPYYQSRRAKTAYVGLACNTPPSPNCFCKAVGGSPSSKEGLDVQLTDLGDRYHVVAVTPRGEELIEAGGKLFAEAGAADEKESQRLHSEAAKCEQRTFGDLAAAAPALKKNFDSEMWQSLAKACIGCGICTFLCPTCHCFDISDEVTGQSPMRGERVRTWDNCQFPDFTMHSSGHNPRETLGARLRQRVNHKFLYFVENNGTQQCTGCGRCISFCPVGIDIVAVLDRMIQA